MRLSLPCILPLLFETLDLLVQPSYFKVKLVGSSLFVGIHLTKCFGFDLFGRRIGATVNIKQRIKSE